MNEDEEVFEEIYTQLDEYYETIDPSVHFYEIEDDMTRLVVNALGMEDIEAIKFVNTWFNNRH